MGLVPARVGDAAARGFAAEPREQQALAAVLKGQGTKEIAEEIHVSVGTVRNLLSSAIHKTGTNNRYLAAAAAQDRGWLQI